MSTVSAHHSWMIWLAYTGFAVFALGIVNQLVLRATFGAREWPLKPGVSNALLAVGGVLVVIGVVMRNG